MILSKNKMTPAEGARRNQAKRAATGTETQWRELERKCSSGRGHAEEKHAERARSREETGCDEGRTDRKIKSQCR
jgi:hypothetical protein